MRNLFLLMVAASVVACVGAPAYQPPDVRVAPSYTAAARRDVGVSRTDSVRAPSNAVVPRDARPAADARAESARYSSAMSDTPFWKEIGDSTLARLVEEALRASTDVDVAEARVTGARASRRVSTFDLGPTVTAVGSATRQRSSMAQVPGSLSQLPQRDLYDVGFDASWELDVFGRVSRTVNAYGTLATSAEHGLRDVQVSLAAEVARSYFELRGRGAATRCRASQCGESATNGQDH